MLRGTVAVTVFEGGGSTQEDGSRLYSSERLVLTASDGDPAHATLESDVVYRWSGLRGGGGHPGPRHDRLATRARSTSGSPSTSASTASRSSSASGGSRIPRNLV